MTPGASGRESDRSDWGGIWLGLAISSLAAFQMLKLPPALPLMSDAYGYDRITAGALVSIYALSGLLLSVAASSLAAQRPVLIMAGSLGCFLLGNLVTLVVPEVAWLNLLARAVEGLAYAVFAIAGPVLANRSAAQRDLSIIAGIVAIWVPVGQIFALTVGFLTFHAYGWRPLWGVSLALTLIVAFWLWRRWRGVAAALAGLAGEASVAAISNRERIVLWCAGGAFAIWGGQYIAFMTWLPAYLVESHGVAAHHTAAANALSVVAVLISALATGGLLQRGVPLGLLFGGACLVQAGVWFAAPHLSGWAGLAAITLYGVVSGAPPTCLFAVPGRLLGGERSGPRAFAPLMTGRNLGIFGAPIAAGWLIGASGWSGMSIVFTLVTLTAMAAGIAMARAITNTKKAA